MSSVGNLVIRHVNARTTLAVSFIAVVAGLTTSLELANVVENVDLPHGITRTEVRTKHDDSPSRPSVS